MANKYRLLFLLTALFLSILAEFSGAAVITSSIDKTTLSVGDRLHFRVAITAKKGSECTPPEPEQLFSKITVKEWNISRKENPQSDSIYIDYIITTYVPENCTIPALPFILKSTSALDTLYTNPVTLQLQSVISAKDTAGIDIKDLRPQQSAGIPPKWWLWTTITLVVLGLIVSIVLFLIRKFKRVPPPPPPIPPYEEAIIALGVLHGKRLLEKGLIREYVFEISEIFKRYIERRFTINASEFTTEEMIAWSGVSGLDKKLKGSIEWFFRTTDPVKFARIIPDAATTDRFTSEVTAFLEATRPLLQTGEGGSGTNAAQQTVQEAVAITTNNAADTTQKINEVQ